jgi:hypothetical protein
VFARALRGWGRPRLQPGQPRGESLPREFDAPRASSASSWCPPLEGARVVPGPRLWGTFEIGMNVLALADEPLGRSSPDTNADSSRRYEKVIWVSTRMHEAANQRWSTLVPCAMSPVSLRFRSKPLVVECAAFSPMPPRGTTHPVWRSIQSIHSGRCVEIRRSSY